MDFTSADGGGGGSGRQSHLLRHTLCSRLLPERQAHRSPSPWPGLRRVAGHRPSLCTGPANCPVSLWPSPSRHTWGLDRPGEGPGIKAKSPYKPPITSHPPQAQVGKARPQNFCTETVHTHFQLTITMKNVAHGSYRRFLERSRNPDTYMRSPLLKSSIIFFKARTGRKEHAGGLH